jgi:sulfhydrogenase subunit alpha
MTKRRIDLSVPILARVEGEGALDLKIRGDKIEQLRLRIYEPPRFFEKFLEGRHVTEVPDLVARICGICPVAYQVSAVNALESLFGIEADPWVTAMRRLLYCGEWIESHALHIHMLAVPDFFGYASGIAMAKDYPDEVRRGLKLQGLGNDIMRMLGGRSVHPIGITIGGFHHAPAVKDVVVLLARLEPALSEAEAMADWVSKIAVPDDAYGFTSVALHSTHYAIERGVLMSSAGHRLQAAEYPEYFTESQTSYSTALWSHLEGGSYLVGPLARLNLQSTASAGSQSTSVYLAERLARYSDRFPSRTMFDSMLARAVEICFALHEAIRILRQYQRPCAPSVAYQIKAGKCFGWSEAPRGLLWHQYEVDSQGLIQSARIVPPTSQNQARIEEDLHQSLYNFGLDHSPQELALHCEKVIRNYDPCISCATHFLSLNLDRQ